MAIYPGAVFKPTTWGGKTPRRKGQRGILHVAVSGARSLPPWNGNTWHFYVAADGYCEQYVDSDFCAWASADANADALSIETQGGLGSSAVLNAEPWTPAAMARLADIMRWANQTEGIPLELLPDSKAGRRGWGPHRLGITHSRGLGSLAGWRVPGGQAWSSVLGKECPGDTKVRQVPQIIEMARSGATGGDDMPLNATDLKLIWETPQATADFGGRANPIVLLENTRTDVINIRSQLAVLTAAVNTLAGVVASGRDDLTAEELRTVIREEMANVVDVQVTVRDGNQPAV